MPGGLSYRHKVPLALSLVVLATVLALTAVTVTRTYAEARAGLEARARRLGAVLTETLAEQLRNDEVWAAYRTVRQAAGGPAEGRARAVICVLDPAGRVFVSSEPERYPLASRRCPGLGPFAALGPDTAAPLATARVREDARWLVLDAPVGAGGGDGGRLLLAYDKTALLPAMYRIVSSNVLAALAILALLLPLAWYWGRRLAAPLVELAGCLRALPEGRAELGELAGYRSRDEVGLLARTFERVVAELGEKREMERRVVAADRLAAAGRLAAGIAHEINNPLAGMLTAIDTFKRRGGADRFTRRTVSLLERGLLQIKDTVSALLVEVRLESRSLAPADLDDVHTLIAPDAQRKGVALHWETGIEGPVPLPATEVRQVLLNLLLNAVHACPPGGRVGCTVRRAGAALALTVSNEGEPIPEPERERLFEPFARASDGGSGLGLWVSYQIVQRLGGCIEVASDEAETRFEVSLPLAGEEQDG